MKIIVFLFATLACSVYSLELTMQPDINKLVTYDLVLNISGVPQPNNFIAEQLISPIAIENRHEKLVQTLTDIANKIAIAFSKSEHFKTKS